MGRPGGLEQVVAEGQVGEAKESGVVGEDELKPTTRHETDRGLRYRSAVGVEHATDDRRSGFERNGRSHRLPREHRHLDAPGALGHGIAGLKRPLPDRHAVDMEEPVGVGL